jgi:hypothetical protein
VSLLAGLYARKFTVSVRPDSHPQITSILIGPSGSRIAVFLEKLRLRDPLQAAATRFRLSQRELQVLALMIMGIQHEGNR